jgi:predicted anti-sigma-YlaC factor YlaD
MNLNSNCENLDAYLSHDLPGDNRPIFESHLEDCPACRDAVDQQQWIDSILCSPARIQLERPPVTILDSLRVSLAQRRRRLLQAACGLATAATLLIAVGLLELNPQANGNLGSAENSVAVTAPAHTPPPVQPAASFVSTSDAIVVPLESPSDEVTIVQVYPTTDTERRWRLEAVLSTNL